MDKDEIIDELRQRIEDQQTQLESLQDRLEMQDKTLAQMFSQGTSLGEVSETLKGILEQLKENSSQATKDIDVLAKTLTTNIFKAFGADKLIKNAASSLPKPLDRLANEALTGAQEITNLVFKSKLKAAAEAKKAEAAAAATGGTAESVAEEAASVGTGSGAAATKAVIGTAADVAEGAGKAAAAAAVKSLPGVASLVARMPAMVNPALAIAALVPTLIELNNTQKALRESGAITGQGFTAGLGSVAKSIRMGANPFDLLSMQFSSEIIDTLRSAGFKDGLAYSLSDSFGGVTKQIGEKLAKDMLPTFVSAASFFENSALLTPTGSGSAATDEDRNKYIKESSARFAEIIESLDKSSKDTTTSTEILNKNYQALASVLMQAGTLTTDKESPGERGTARVLADLLLTLTKTQGAEQPGMGIAVNPMNPLGISKAITGAAPYLAGMAGIPAPLALVNSGANVVSTQFMQLWGRLAAQMPEALKNDPTGSGYRTYAAFLLAGFLPAIGMADLTVEQVAALLKGNPNPGSGNDKFVSQQATDIQRKGRSAAKAIFGTSVLDKMETMKALAGKGDSEHTERVKKWEKETGLSKEEIAKYLGSRNPTEEGLRRLVQARMLENFFSTRAGTTGKNDAKRMEAVKLLQENPGYYKYNPNDALGIAKPDNWKDMTDEEKKNWRQKAIDAYPNTVEFNGREVKGSGVTDPITIVVQNIINGRNLEYLIKDIESYQKIVGG